MRLYGTGRWASVNEKQQFGALRAELAGADLLLGDWAYLMTNVPYEHDAVTRIENDTRWKGEYDCILFARRFVVIYEVNYHRHRRWLGALI